MRCFPLPSPSSSFAASASARSWRLDDGLGLDLGGDDGETGSGAEPAEDRVVRRGVTGCNIAERVGGGRRRTEGVGTLGRGECGG